MFEDRAARFREQQQIRTFVCTKCGGRLQNSKSVIPLTVLWLVPVRALVRYWRSAFYRMRVERVILHDDSGNVGMCAGIISALILPCRLDLRT